MRLKSIAAFASAACLIATGAGAINSSPDKVQEKLSKFEKTGETTSCLMLRSIRDTDIVDDNTMLIEASGETYLNELSGRCSGLSREGRYVHKSSGARMCQGDILQVIDSFGTMRGACSLGPFEKLSKIPQAE